MELKEAVKRIKAEGGNWCARAGSEQTYSGITGVYEHCFSIAVYINDPRCHSVSDHELFKSDSLPGALEQALAYIAEKKAVACV